MTGRAASTSCARPSADGSGRLRAVHRAGRGSSARTASPSCLATQHLGGVQLRRHRRRRLGRLAGTSPGSHRSVDLRRPFLDFGVPFRFHDWDLEFIAWLNRTGSAGGLPLRRRPRGASRTATSSRARYDLVVFPGHEEYVTRHAYDVIERYRDDGGNLAFSPRTTSTGGSTASAQTLVRRELWRKLGRPESRHRRRSVRRVGPRPAAGRLHRHWVRSAGAVGLRRHRSCPTGTCSVATGSRSTRTAASPRDIQVLARHSRPARSRPVGGDDLLRDTVRREGLRAAERL